MQTRQSSRAKTMNPAPPQSAPTPAPQAQPVPPEVESMSAALAAATLACPHLLFLPEAARSAARSGFKNPARILQALIILDEVAAGWAGDPNATLGSWRERFRKMGLEYKDRISMTARGKHGREYNYVYGGRTVLFEKHFTFGVGMSPERCASIHFERDDSLRRIVVAHVGRHKSNTRTS